ncbi:TPA: hypothetical protein I7284_23855 [Vibrio parahaemolyticus]|nr:hypothetical protein [Vibrio parahaemolyticus]
MVNNEKNSNSNWKLASFLLIGVLIPLLAASIPWLLDYALPQNSLSYQYIEPIELEEATAVSVTVTNEGRETQHDIEIWLPFRVISGAKSEVGDDGRLRVTVTEPEIQLESSIPYKSSELTDKHFLIKFDALRPNESASIKLVSTGARVMVSSYDLERMRVVSKTSVAKSAQPTEHEFLLFRTGSIILVVLIVVFFAWAIYYEHLMPYETKEKHLLKQIDDLTTKKQP